MYRRWSVWNEYTIGTMNGWCSVLASCRSVSTCSTCFLRMITSFFSTFIAKRSWPSSLTRNTLPKFPPPRVFTISKSAKCGTLMGFLRHSSTNAPTTPGLGSSAISARRYDSKNSRRSSTVSCTGCNESFFLGKRARPVSTSGNSLASLLWKARNSLKRRRTTHSPWFSHKTWMWNAVNVCEMAPASTSFSLDVAGIEMWIGCGSGADSKTRSAERCDMRAAGDGPGEGRTQGSWWALQVAHKWGCVCACGRCTLCKCHRQTPAPSPPPPRSSWRRACAAR
jgi:hypothetical protein